MALTKLKICSSLGINMSDIVDEVASSDAAMAEAVKALELLFCEGDRAARKNAEMVLRKHGRLK